MKIKMWDVTIRIKKNDEVGGKCLQSLVMDLLIKAGVSGATVWTGVNGFGKRGKSTLKLEGVTVNMPLIIKVIDEQSKLGCQRLRAKNRLTCLLPQPPSLRPQSCPHLAL